MGRPLSFLLIDDCEDDALLLLMCLRESGFDPVHQRVQSGLAMAAALDAQPWDLVISDHHMASFSAPEALKLLRSKGSDAPFIIVSGSIGEGAAVAAMRAGAQDCLVKGQLARLPAVIERELRDAEERRGRKEAEQKIRFLAYFDPLTSLPNRANFCEQLAHRLTISTRTGNPLAVIGVKLDNLREINNTLGYCTGERVLAELASRLRHAVAAPQLLARIGGAEFAVLLPDDDAGSATVTAQQLQAAIAGPVQLDSLEVETTASFGIALYPNHGDEAERLLQRTNVAITQAADGPSHIAIYSRERDPFQPQRLTLIAELRRAIIAGELRLHYQPKVDFERGTFCGVEALVRWAHPKLGVLRPDLFVSLAEQSGLINALTRWVLKEAAAQARVWQRQGLDLRIAINLSAKNLQSDELADHLARRVSAGRYGGAKLVVEVTESAIMADELRAQDILRRLLDHDVEVAIDDFGTGYSSFARLRELPVSELKIDKSFVKRMGRSKADHLIVASIIELGHKLGLKVVAEGVETASSWNALAHLQCDVAQGYLLSRPMPAHHILPWCKSFVAPAVLYGTPLDLPPAREEQPV